jgi:hypothetical protein
MVAAKPDCTGQKFGRLTVVGKGDIHVAKDGRRARKWRLDCECGLKIQLVRNDFDKAKGGQKSCGCLGRDRKNSVDNKRRPQDWAGQKIGNLLVISMIEGVRHQNNASIWECLCDCGATVYMDAKRLHKGIRANCGAAIHQPGLKRPPTPSPYPEQAAEIVKTYLHLVNSKRRETDINAEIEDERMDRLIRAAWIITCRRWQGENLDHVFERNYIQKYMRLAYVAIKVKKIRQNIPIKAYTRDDSKKPIGIGMTNAIFPRVTEDIFESGNLLRESKPRRFKFKTC